jgi:hypothetical protein
MERKTNLSKETLRECLSHDARKELQAYQKASKILRQHIQLLKVKILQSIPKPEAKQA